MLEMRQETWQHLVGRNIRSDWKFSATGKLLRDVVGSSPLFTTMHTFNYPFLPVRPLF